MSILILVGYYIALLGNYVLCIQVYNLSNLPSISSLRRYVTRFQDEFAKYDNQRHFGYLQKMHQTQGRPYWRTGKDVFGRLSMNY